MDEIEKSLENFCDEVVRNQKEDFITYVKKYSTEHRMTPFDACAHALVKEYGYGLGLSDDDMMEIRKDI